jgi:hypothetical protein
MDEDPNAPWNEPSCDFDDLLLACIIIEVILVGLLKALGV